MTAVLNQNPTRMVYLHYISCLRYTILVGNPDHTGNVNVNAATHALNHLRKQEPFK